MPNDDTGRIFFMFDIREPLHSMSNIVCSLYRGNRLISLSVY